MADTERKFSELETAATLNDGDIFAASQTDSGTLVSKKTTLLAIANRIADGVNFAGLQTESKKLIGAINEAAQSGGGSSVEVTPVRTTGEKIATITVDETDADLYAISEKEIAGAFFGEQEAEGNPVQVEAIQASTVKSLKVELEPIQDLHGYNNPWVGGAGKNKFNTTITTQTINGTQFVVNADGSITITGTPTDNISGISFGAITLSAGTYIANGCSFSGSGRTLTRINVYNNTTSTEIGRIYNGVEEVEFTLTEESVISLRPIVLTSFSGTATFYPMIRLSTVADATFAPYSNICPISGRNSVELVRTGKNLVEITRTGSITLNGITWIVNSDGTVTANGTATATSVFHLKQTTDFGKDLQPNTEYIISSGYGNNNVWFGFYYDNSSNWGMTVANDGERTFTTISDFNYVRFGIRIGSGVTVNNVTFKPMVRLSTISNSTFEKYNGQTYTATFPDTVYGGKLDFVSGKLIIDRAIVDLSQLTFKIAGSGDTARFQTDELTDIKLSGSNNIPVDAICSSYKVVSWAAMNNDDKVIMVQGTNSRLAIKNTAYSTAEDFMASLTSADTFCYKLATPTEITLTAEQISLLKGQNVISTTGDKIALAFSKIITFDDVTGTLEAGETSLTIQSPIIKESSTVEIFTSKYGVNPADVSVAAGSITILFEAQAEDIKVKVRIS